MPQKGTFTALQQLRPVQTDFGAIAQGEEDRLIALKKRQKDERKRQEAEQARIAKNFKQDYSTLTNVITETKSIDEAFARGIGQARDMMGDIYKKIQSSPTLANDVNTQLKLQNLNKFSKNLRDVSDRYTEYAQTLSQGITDGSLSSWNDDTLNTLDSIFKDSNLDVKVDDVTGLPIAVTYKIDDDGNPITNSKGEPILEELNLAEVLDGRGLSEQVENYDMAAEARKIGPDLGKRTMKKPDGSFSHYEYQSFDQIEGSVRDLVKGLVGTANNPSDIAKSIWSDVLGGTKKDLTTEDMKDIEDAYTNTIRAFYDETAKRETNFSARTSAINAARKGKKDAPTGPGIELRTDEDNNPLQGSPVGVSGDLGGGGVSFSLPAPVAVGPKGKQFFVDKLYLTNSGKVAFEADFKAGKGGDIEYTDPSGELVVISKDIYDRFIGGGFNADQLNDIARQVGLRNAAELKQELENARTRHGQSQGGGTTSKAQELINKYK